MKKKFNFYLNLDKDTSHINYSFLSFLPLSIADFMKCDRI